MGDPLSVLATGAGFTVKASQFILQLNAVDSETKIIIQQVKWVLGDIAEAERLYSERKASLSDADEYRTKEVIRQNVWTINEIAKQVEPARKSIERSGSTKLAERLDWVLRRSGNAKSYKDLLTTSQGALHNQISMLRAVTSGVPTQAPPPYEENFREEHGACGYRRVDEFSILRDDGIEKQEQSNEWDEAHKTHQWHAEDAQPESESDEDNGEASASTKAWIHPERDLYQNLQGSYKARCGRGEAAHHPERILYQTMQNQHKR